MNIRDEIMESMTKIKKSLTPKNPIFIEKPERAPYVEREFQLITYMLRKAIPIRMDRSTIDLLEVGADFGEELLDMNDESVDAMVMNVTPRLPYDVVMFYGPLMNSEWEDQQNRILLAGYINSQGNDAGEKNALVIVDIYKSRALPRNISWFPDSVAFRLDPNPAILTSPSEGYLLEPDDPDLEKIKDRGSQAIHYFVACYGMLNMKHTMTTETSPAEKLQKAREAKGKLPLPTTVEVKLDPRYAIRGAGPGTHASPRPHWRRGHVRTLQSGKRVPVQPHMVMGDAPLPKELVVKK